MNPKSLCLTGVLCLGLLPVFAEDGERTAPFTAAEMEAVYTASIEKRTSNILVGLEVADAAKARRVHDAIVAQYRSLRARDAALDTMFQTLAQNTPGVETNRNAVMKILSRQLHEQFLTRLAADLTPAQIEIVKDKMTYNKVKVTYDAYCQILPKLTDAEKAKILEALKVAREEAMDGGSADEKTAIFQKHKEGINAMLDANGHNVSQAIKEWEAKQDAAGATASAK